MPRALFAHPWYFDLATVDSGDWRAALPVTNLQDMQPSRLARTTNLSNTFFVVEFTTAVLVDAMALVATNLTAAATIRVRTAASEGNLTAAPTYDSTAVSAWPATGRPTDPGLTAWTVFKNLTANATARVWLRVDLSDAGNGDGYIDIGRCIAATADTTPIITARAPRRQPADIVNRTPFGHTLTQARLRPRAIDLTVQWQTEAAWLAGVDELDRLRGTALDLIVCTDTDATTYLHKHVIHGVLLDAIPFSNSAANLYAARISIVELL